VFKELIVRWFQFGAFCPLFRVHGYRTPTEHLPKCGPDSGAPNEIWSFGDQNYPILAKLLYLRQALRPYILGLMREASEKGTPVVRPLFMEFPKDPKCLDVDDAFMFGTDWLVAPVTKYRSAGQTVYLPALANNLTWTHFYSQKQYPGGSSYAIDTPLHSFPLFYTSRSTYYDWRAIATDYFAMDIASFVV